MRSLLSLRVGWFGVACVSALLMISTAAVARAGDYGFNGDASGLVETLAASNDMQPHSASIASQRSVRPVSSSVTPASAAESRGVTSSGELFSNSKAVLPLLVGDLEPSVVSVARPITGSSVGARPSLPWSRSSASR